jgi:hypothetical protein
MRAMGGFAAWRVAATMLLSLSLLGCGLTAVGAPVVPPGRSCQGVAPDICQREFDSVQGGRPGQQIVGFHMRCTAAVCDVRAGEAEVRVAWAGGSSESYGSSWAGADPEPAVPAPEPGEPAPGLPVQHECVGVPERACLDMALAAVENAGSATIIAIRIECTRAAGCDLQVGDGDAIVRLKDGTEVRSTWGYSS